HAFEAPQKTDMRLIKDRFMPGPALPVLVAPFITAVVHHHAGPLHVIQLQSRGRIRKLSEPLRLEAVRRAGRAAMAQLKPALRLGLHRQRILADMHGHLRAARRPQAEPHCRVIHQLGTVAVCDVFHDAGSPVGCASRPPINSTSECAHTFTARPFTGAAAAPAWAVSSTRCQAHGDSGRWKSMSPSLPFTSTNESSTPPVSARQALRSPSTRPSPNAHASSLMGEPSRSYHCMRTTPGATSAPASR